MLRYGAILLTLVCACGQTVDSARLDALFRRAAFRVRPGLEVMIVRDGRQVYWKQFGRWPKNQQVPIASATKWYSGALIMSLVDSGTLSLEDKASKYLPYMTGEKSGITIRQLMSHTAGFPGEFPVADSCLGDPATRLEDCARRLARLKLSAPPGTVFIYSGAGMQIAGRAVEVAAGKDWQTLFRERIAEPLGLTATDYEYRGPTRNPRVSGGGRSTVSDYMKFLIMLSHRGVFEGRRVLSDRAVETMLSDQTGGVPIVRSPYQEFVALDSRAPANRYGIGNWLEDPGSLQNSSQGAFGFSPLIDRKRRLLVVAGVHNLLRNFEVYYYEMKRILAE